jgi:4-amino-4-deoxychorismate lyase
MPVESPLRGRNNQHFGLIETLRYEPDFGCIRADRHVARMETSAAHFSRKFDANNARSLLAKVSGEAPLRLRLFLDEQDRLSLTSHPFVPVPEVTIWKVAIAQSIRLEANNPFLAHKTTLRSHYDQARAEYPVDMADEIILLNEQGHVCEGTITSVFVEQERILMTPPLADGLLRGILREELLETGKAIEHPLVPDDLERGQFFVGNSLRGLLPARLVKP